MDAASIDVFLLLERFDLYMQVILLFQRSSAMPIHPHFWEQNHKRSRLQNAALITVSA
jgi:hypothetical protein